MPFTGPPAPFRNFGSTIANLGQRAATALGYKPPADYISQISPTAWPNPGQPIAPVGPRGSNPLSVPFWMGSNLNYQPRPDAEYSAAALKTLANFPLASVCINNVEDQVTQMRWRIQLRQKVGETSQERQKRELGDENILMLSRFFERPDGFNMWDDWLRPYIDAMLVYDAPAIEVIRRRSGSRIEKLRVIPGHDIARYITDTGDTPEPPDPAYSQNWEGVSRLLLTTDQLFYRPRNIQPRNTLSSYLYGNSAIAQTAPWIEIGILRLAFVHLYYTTGAVPDMIQVAPPSVTVDKLKEMTMWWNSEFAGQLDKRRGLSIIQGFTEDGKDQFLFPKKDLLSDPFDDLLIRYIAFGIGSSPQRLLRPMNRASANTSQEAAEEEGTAPVVNAIVSRINYVIWFYFGLRDYEIRIDLARESDVVKAATADKIRVDAGLKTRNDILLANGDERDPNPLADQLTITTGSGAVPLGLINTSQGAIPLGEQLVSTGDSAGSAKKLMLIERGTYSGGLVELKG